MKDNPIKRDMYCYFQLCINFYRNDYCLDEPNKYNIEAFDMQLIRTSLNRRRKCLVTSGIVNTPLKFNLTPCLLV